MSINTRGGPATPDDLPNTDQVTSNERARVSTPFGFKSRQMHPSISLGNRQLEELAKKLKSIYKDMEIQDFKVIKVDNKTHNSAYSCILVCGHTTTPSDDSTKKGKTTVAAYPMLIEATGDIQSSRLENINTQALMPGVNNRRPEMFRVPSDAFDNVLSSIILSVVQNSYGNEAKVKLIDGTVLSTLFDVDKEELSYVVAEIALEAIMVSLLKDTENIELVLQTEMKQLSQHERLEYRVNTDRGTITDEAQRPVYYNWAVDLSIKNTGQYQRSINDINNEKLLIRTTGFTDVIPVSEQIASGTVGMPLNAVRFRPHLIIDHSYGIYTTGWVLMNLISSLVFKDNLWLNTIKPQKDDPNHDPGGLNILANIEGNPSGVGEKIDFFASGLTEFDVTSTLTRLFAPGMVVSLDIDMFGPQTWAYSNFAIAATGGPKQDLATRNILAAANNLTGGAFSTAFSGSVFTNVTQIPRGYWTDPNGTTRDLREFDVIAILNQFGNDVGAVNEFINYYLNGGYGNITAIYKILELYKKILPTAVITGWVIRATFSGEFMQTLESAVASAGFSATIDSPVLDNSMMFNNVGQYMSGAVINPGAPATARTRQAQNFFGNMNVPGAWY